jgi:prolyl-tRNA synthetase
MELIGVPHRIVVGERGLKDGKLEYQGRRDKQAQPVDIAGAAAFVQGKVCAP